MVIDENIRLKCVCVFGNKNRLLLEKGYDPDKQEHFFIPPGGGVNFEERAADAIVREIREEFQADIKDVKLLGVLESIFTFDGQSAHEIVFVFDATFVDESLYEQEVLKGREEGYGDIEAMWMTLDEAEKHPWPVYPDGLLSLISDGCR